MSQPTDRIPDLPGLPTISQQTNLPGLRRLCLIETRFVDRLVDPRTVPDGFGPTYGLPEGGLQLIDDAVLYELRFPASAGTYTQKTARSAQGVSYPQTLTINAPKDHPLTAFAFSQMIGRRWIAIYQDANVSRKVVGTPRQPLLFSFEQSVGLNVYTLTWSGETRQPAWFLTETDSLLLEAYFSYTYDF